MTKPSPSPSPEHVDYMHTLLHSGWFWPVVVAIVVLLILMISVYDWSWWD